MSMEQKEIIQQVRKLVSSANTEKALAVLASHFDEGGADTVDLFNEVLQLTARFEQTQKDEQLGTISSPDAKVNYNQVTSRVLDIVKDLENPSKVLKEKRRSPVMAIVGGSIAILAVAAYFLWPTKTSNDCPGFAPNTDFDILVLPFRPIAGDLTLTHELFEIGLNRLIDDNQLNDKADVESYDPSFAQSDRYPTGNQDARSISDDCMTQLILWGRSEVLPAENMTILTTNYLFLEESEIHLDRQAIGMDTELESTDISMEFPKQGRQIDTIASFSGLSDNIPENLKARMKFLLGVFAHESGDNMATQKILEEWPADPFDPESTAIWGNLLADSYLKTNNTVKAEETYDKILKNDPDNQLARNNRAILYYEKGKYRDALRDLNTNLEKNENDTVALTTRSYIYMEADKLDRAEVDLERAKQLDPDRPIITRWSEKLEEKKNTEKQKIEAADKVLDKEKDNVNALLSKADAESNLGNYSIARKTAERVIALNPKIGVAHAIVIEADAAENKESSNHLRRAAKNGIKEEVINSRRLIPENRAKKE